MRRKIRVLVFTAFLIALEVALNRFGSFNTAGLKIGVSFIPGVVGAVLYGPLVGALVNGGGDFLGAVLFPIGPYHPGFTICAAAMGFLNGMFLYNKPVDIDLNKPSVSFKMTLKWEKIRIFPNVVIPVLINTIIIGLFINTVWVSMLYGSKTYWGWFVYRLSEYAVLIPVKLIITPIVMRLVRPLKRIAAVSEK